MACGGGRTLSELPRRLRADERALLVAETNLNDKEVDALYSRFRKVAAPNATMTLEQFRGSLGILGLTENNFL